ncbi:uncharacterized protein An13g03020 [Aspergillus niger]|uniref:Contig An13c0090, genomic contig n=2 Tax=Aspergillus niger TaxID=5061 RepID=A2R1Z8_ASPNC|nr:uncharacterized protein An13g03020 [Aspergillus niger]CAK41698.1 unnamed protein product [Aspergillus niger]
MIQPGALHAVNPSGGIRGWILVSLPTSPVGFLQPPGRDSSGSSTTRLSGMRDCDSETSLKSLQVKMESDPHTPCRYLPLGFSMAIA